MVSVTKAIFWILLAHGSLGSTHFRHQSKQTPRQSKSTPSHHVSGFGKDGPFEIDFMRLTRSNEQGNPLIKGIQKTSKSTSIFGENLFSYIISFFSFGGENEKDSLQFVTYESTDDSFQRTEHNKQKMEAETDQKPCRMCGSDNLGSPALSEEEIKAIRLEQATQLLKQKMRLESDDLSKPGISNHHRRHAKHSRRIPKLPGAILQQTEEFDSDMEVDNFHARELQTIIPGQDISRQCEDVRDAGCYSFPLGRNVNSEIKSAKLWFFNTLQNPDDKQRTFIVKDLLRHSNGTLQHRHHDHTRKIHNVDSDNWTSIDVTHTIELLVTDGIEKAAFSIKCLTCRIKNHRAVLGAKKGYKPVLVIAFGAKRHVRRKRMTDESCSPTSACCRRELSVNTWSVGIYTLDTSTDIPVGYCYGQCRGITSTRFFNTELREGYRLGENNLNHSMRQQLKPCCVPVAFRAGQITRYNDVTSATETISIPNMLVTECGCV